MDHVLLKGLLLLSFCSAFGSALLCYDCDTADDLQCNKQQCSPAQDTCLNATFHTSKRVYRRCWIDRMCTYKDLESSFTIDSKISFTCCDWDLCNSKSVGTPRAHANPSLLGLLAAFASLQLCCFRS
uniref:CD59A glycoprotein-like n=1 Tax=Pristiophorus japonicus TaxID=55135 RepID=UPI00398E400E